MNAFTKMDVVVPYNFVLKITLDTRGDCSWNVKKRKMENKNTPGLEHTAP